MDIKGFVPHSLWQEVGAELEKDSENIAPDFISSRIDKLCALENLSVPALSDEQLREKAARISALARSTNKRNPSLKRSFKRRVIPWAIAAACLLFFLFSINFLLARSTGECFIAMASGKTCCGTSYCPCIIAADTHHP